LRASDFLQPGRGALPISAEVQKIIFLIAGDSTGTLLNVYHSLMSLDVLKAIKKGDVLHLRHYLESGSDPDYPDSLRRSEATLLMYAAQVGNTAIGSELISHGASLDAHDSHGWTALNMAVHTGHIQFVELLLDAGASLDGHAFRGPIEDFFEWSLTYGTGTKEAMSKIKPIMESARLKLVQCAAKPDPNE